MMVAPVTRLVDLVPDAERFSFVKTFIVAACGYQETPERVVDQVASNLDRDIGWDMDTVKRHWLDLIVDHPDETIDLAKRVIAWLRNPSHSERARLIDDLRMP